MICQCECFCVTLYCSDDELNQIVFELCGVSAHSCSKTFNKVAAQMKTIRSSSTLCVM